MHLSDLSFHYIDKFVNKRLVVAPALSCVHDVPMRASRGSDSKPNRSRLSPEARYNQLLDHAVKAFAASGIERAVHADVAALANVSTPTVFKYFPNREALVGAVLDRIETTITELINRIPEDSKLTVRDMMDRLAQALSILCETQPDLMKVGLAWSVAFSSVRERYVTFQERKLDMLSARLSSTAQERSDARILLGVALLYIRMHFDGSSGDVRQRYVQRLTELWESAPSR